MKKKEDLSPLQALLVVIGILAWVIAGIFATQEPVKSTGTSGSVAMASNNVAAAGVLGFAIGGGLCFTGVALLGRPNKNEPPSSPPAS